MDLSDEWSDRGPILLVQSEMGDARENRKDNAKKAHLTLQRKMQILQGACATGTTVLGI